MNKKIRIAINGFGRIGRIFFRHAFGNPELEFVAINDLGSPENMAYLLKYDTVYGPYDKSVEAKNGELIVNGKKNTDSSGKRPDSFTVEKLKY